jgi:hypothetical protein
MLNLVPFSGAEWVMAVRPQGQTAFSLVQMRQQSIQSSREQLEEDVERPQVVVGRNSRLCRWRARWARDTSTARTATPSLAGRQSAKRLGPGHMVWFGQKLVTGRRSATLRSPRCSPRRTG